MRFNLGGKNLTGECVRDSIYIYAFHLPNSCPLLFSTGNLWVLTYVLSNQYVRALSGIKNSNGKPYGNSHKPQWVRTLCFMNTCYSVVRIIEGFTLNPKFSSDAIFVPGSHIIKAIWDANNLTERERKVNKSYDTYLAPLLKTVTLDSVLRTSFFGKLPYQRNGIPMIDALILVSTARLVRDPPTEICFTGGKKFTGNLTDTKYFTVDGKQTTAHDKLVLESGRGFVSLYHEACLCFKQRDEKWLLPEDQEFVDKAVTLHNKLGNTLHITFEDATTTPAPKIPRKRRPPSSGGKTSAMASLDHKPLGHWDSKVLTALPRIAWDEEETYKNDKLAKAIADAMKDACHDPKDFADCLAVFQERPIHTLLKDGELTEPHTAEEWDDIFGGLEDKANFREFQVKLREIPQTRLQNLEKWPCRDRGWVRKLVDEKETIPDFEAA